MIGRLDHGGRVETADGGPAAGAWAQARGGGGRPCAPFRPHDLARAAACSRPASPSRDWRSPGARAAGSRLRRARRRRPRRRRRRRRRPTPRRPRRLPHRGGSSALLLDEDAPASVPASLFQEDGPTLEEWAADQADFRDLEGVTRIEESVADGDLRLTLADVPEGTRHRVVLVCPDGATGGSALSLGEGGAVERRVWSEDCGWTATLPPLSEQRDVTFLVRADDGGPFRFVVGEVEGDGQG